jgi:hypothetical protein
VDPLKRLEQDVLDKIFCVGEIASPLRQAAAGPSLERLEMPGEEAVDGALISRPGPVDQIEGRLRIVARPVAKGPLIHRIRSILGHGSPETNRRFYQRRPMRACRLEQGAVRFSGPRRFREQQGHHVLICPASTYQTLDNSRARAHLV